MTVIVNSGAGIGSNGESPAQVIGRHLTNAGIKAGILQPSASHNLSRLARESAQDSDGIIVASVDAAEVNGRIFINNSSLACRTAFLFVGNNDSQIAGFNLGARQCIDRGNLGLYRTHRTGRFGLFRLGLHALFGRVDQAKDFEAFCVKKARIETRKRRLLVACDGEVEWMKTPLHYRSRQNALRVLVPKKEAEAAS